MTDYRIGPLTTRLILRAMTTSDADAFYLLNSNSDVMRFTGEDRLQSLDEAREALKRYPDFKKVGYGRWGCFLKESEQLIGFCGLKYLEDLDVVDIGYRFLPEYWGRGFATEACLASLNFGFETLMLARIEAFVLPQNLASVRVLEKVGMRSEGMFHYDGFQVLRYSIHN